MRGLHCGEWNSVLRDCVASAVTAARAAQKTDRHPDAGTRTHRSTRTGAPSTGEVASGCASVRECPLKLCLNA
jgi:hypothetical protein